MKTRLYRRGAVGFLSLAGLLVLMTARSDGQNSAGGGPAGEFIKIGRHHINVHWITFTTEQSKALVVYFGDSAHSSLRLTGDEAKDMRQWLDRRTLEPLPLPARQRKPLMEGVDILDRKPGDRARPPIPEP